MIAARPRLDTLAQRLEVNAQTWDGLVLPEPEKKLLRQIMDQVGLRHHVYERWGFSRRMSRGLGISALFAAPRRRNPYRPGQSGLRCVPRYLLFEIAGDYPVFC